MVTPSLNLLVILLASIYCSMFLFRPGTWRTRSHQRQAWTWHLVSLYFFSKPPSKCRIINRWRRAKRAHHYSASKSRCHVDFSIAIPVSRLVYCFTVTLIAPRIPHFDLVSAKHGSSLKPNDVTELQLSCKNTVIVVWQRTVVKCRIKRCANLRFSLQQFARVPIDVITTWRHYTVFSLENIGATLIQELWSNFYCLGVKKV